MASTKFCFPILCRSSGWKNTRCRFVFHQIFHLERKRLYLDDLIVTEKFRGKESEKIIGRVHDGSYPEQSKTSALASAWLEYSEAISTKSRRRIEPEWYDCKMDEIEISFLHFLIIQPKPAMSVYILPGFNPN